MAAFKARRQMEAGAMDVHTWRVRCEFFLIFGLAGGTIQRRRVLLSRDADESAQGLN